MTWPAQREMTAALVRGDTATFAAFAAAHARLTAEENQS